MLPKASQLTYGPFKRAVLKVHERKLKILSLWKRESIEFARIKWKKENKIPSESGAHVQREPVQRIAQVVD